MKILALATASSLTLLGGAFLSSAYADSTPAPTPSISSDNGGNPLDNQVNDETDSSGLVSDNQDVQNLISDQLAMDVNNSSEATQNGDSNGLAVDAQVENLNVENQQEGDSFTQDISQADQNGNQDDAVELQADATIVADVTAPELADIANDDTVANDIIVGTPLK